MSAPQTVATIGIFDYIYDETGVAVSGAKVDVTLQYNQAVNNTPQVSVAPVKYSTRTDTNGNWTLNVVPNLGMTPTGTTYMVSTQYNSYEISVPATGGPYQTTSIAVTTPGSLPSSNPIVSTLTVTGSMSVGGNVAIAGPDPWIDVTAPPYHADSTGTIDSTAAINAALAAALSGGGIVWIPKGTYKVSGTAAPALKIATGQQIYIRGAGMGRTIIQASSASTPTAVLDTLANNTYVSDLTIDGNGVAGYGIFLDDDEINGGSYQSCITNVRIVNCQGTPGYAISNQDHAYSLILYNVHASNNKVALVLGGHAQNLQASNCVFASQTGATVNGQSIGNISLTSLAGAFIHDCDIEIPTSSTALINISLVGCRPFIFQDCYVGCAGTGSQEFVIGGTSGTNNNGAIRGIVVDAESQASAIVTILSNATSWLTCQDWYSFSTSNVNSVSDASNVAALTMTNLQGTSMATTDTLGSSSPDLYGVSGTPRSINQGAQFISHSTASNIKVGIVGDSQPRFLVTSQGIIEIGPGGSTAPDTVLQRRSAGLLSTNGTTNLQAGAGLYPSSFGSFTTNSLYVVSGVPASGSGSNGDTVHRTDAALTYTKLSGAWVQQNPTKFTTSITPGSVAATTIAEQTFTVTGVATGQVVAVSSPSAQTAGIGIVGCRVSATNTVAIAFHNITAGSLTPVSGSYVFLAQ